MNLSFLKCVVAGAFTASGDQDGGIGYAPLMQILADAGYGSDTDRPQVRKPLPCQALGLATLKQLARVAGPDKG